MTALQWIAYIAPNIDSNNSLEKKNAFISTATTQTSKTYFKNDSDTYNLAVAYYACHLLELSSQDGAMRGPLSSEKEGDLMRSYANSSGGDSCGNATQYYKEYKRLLESRIPNFYINGC